MEFHIIKRIKNYDMMALDVTESNIVNSWYFGFSQRKGNYGSGQNWPNSNNTESLSYFNNLASLCFLKIFLKITFDT